MPLRKLKRQPDQLGTLSLFATLDQAERGRSLLDVTRQQDALELMRSGLSESLANESRVHGWRAQALFEAIVVELGGVRLLKAEDDEAACWFSEDASVKLPDFRAVTGDGEHLVIEVKTVGPARTTDRISPAEMDGLRTYADLTGARLVLAHYWSRFNVWTLSDAALYATPAGAVIELEQAMRANEMGTLGDRSLATAHPLALRLHADQANPRSLDPAGPGEQLASFVIGEVSVLSQDRVLIDPLEARVALFLMYFGGWEVEQTAQLADGKVTAVDFSFIPVEEARSGPPPAMVGALSSMYTTFFNFATLDDDGNVSKLRREPTPGGLAELVPDDYFDNPDRRLPLWRFTLQPSLGPRAVSATLREPNT